MRIALFCIGILALNVEAAFERYSNSNPTLVELAKKLGLNEFVKHLEETGLDKVLERGEYTVFAPTDEAFRQETHHHTSHHTPLSDKLKFHISSGNLKSVDFRDNLMLRSLLEKRYIRINVYDNDKERLTANGRQVVRFDHEARNGVLHVVSDVMSSVYDKDSSVLSELKKKYNDEHSTFLSLVSQCRDVYKTLDTTESVTLLAPTNEAFSKLPRDFITYLKNNNKLCDFLYSHVVHGTYFTTGLVDGKYYKTHSGDKVRFTVGEKTEYETEVVENGQIKKYDYFVTGDVYFNDAHANKVDLLGVNGAIHTLDSVLFVQKYYPHLNQYVYNLYTLPKVSDADLFPHSYDTNVKEKSFFSQRKTLTQVLKDAGYTSFVEALRKTQLDKVLDDETYTFTVFAPTNDAFEHPDNYPQHFTLEDKVRYHVVKGFFNKESFENEMTVPTLLKDRKVRFNVYGDDQTTVYTVNGRRVNFKTYTAGNGLVHELTSGLDYVYKGDETSRPTYNGPTTTQKSGTLMKEIESVSQFSKFVELMKKFDLFDVLDNQFNLYTVFVPNNDVLNKEQLTYETAVKVFKNHVFPRSLYTVQFPYFKTDSTEQVYKTDVEQFVSLGGKYFYPEGKTYTQKGTWTFGGAKVLTRDYTARNGVFHEVDSLFQEQRY